MKFPVIFTAFLAACGIAHADWKIGDATPAQSASSQLVYQRKKITKEGATGYQSARDIDVVWFRKSEFTFKVVDNGAGPKLLYSSLKEAMTKNGCVAGCNGGFFLKDFSPSGLMIESGKSTGRFGTGGLLSGVVLTSGKGNPYLLRRAEYGPIYKPTELLQSGPFLVDQGVTVNGLSPKNSRRRSFVLHDGGEWFALGISDPFTLAELGEILADPDFAPSQKIHRALNLDGGTSTGFYVNRGEGMQEISIEPYKTVRNFIGIVPR
ncbi:MAG: hypothetical protein CMO55_22025 [Verrucomicrobiales bacterium]|nr:hypothetical protein [Verrucomicrobiales bacterium]